MPPHDGLVHQQEYDWRDSNVALIGSDIDHKVKYNSALTEPAWSGVGEAPGLRVWRIEDFQVVAWPKDKYGQFYDGDSYIVLYSYKVGDKDGQEHLNHDIFFWLGNKTTQDEAGTAAYKTVELDEFLKGSATQHRELQSEPSDEFVALFPRITIRSGGVRSGFTHVDMDKKPDSAFMLLRIFKHPSAKRADSVIVHEVEPNWQSLDENDVFVLEKDNKIWVWQGRKCTPMEKMKAAQVVNDLTLAKHIDTEVVSQAESRSRAVVALLGGADAPPTEFHATRPLSASRGPGAQASSSRPRRLMRLSDASGELRFEVVKEGSGISRADLDGNDVFILDTGSDIWVWEGSGSSRNERQMWLKVAQSYIQHVSSDAEGQGAFGATLSKVVEGRESPAFSRALEVR